MSDQKIPNTESKEVAMIAAALEIAVRTHRTPRNTDEENAQQMIDLFTKAYTAIRETVRGSSTL